MTPETFTVTVEEVYNALKKNGFYLLREEWIEFEGTLVTAACVLVQTAINLGAMATYMDARNLGIDIDYVYDEHHSYQEPGSLLWELNKIPGQNTGPWATTSSSGAASQIIHWNDKFVPADSEWDDELSEYVEDGDGHYLLQTYEEVAAMAYDILSPHFDKTLTLYRQEWNTGE